MFDNRPYKFWVKLKYPNAVAVNFGGKKVTRLNGKHYVTKDNWVIMVGRSVIGSAEYWIGAKKQHGTAHGAWRWVAMNMNKESK